MEQQEILAECILPDVAAVKEFACRIAPLLKLGDVLALDGALGAGKTELCRAIIHGLGESGDVPSPTFNLVQIYDRITPVVWHMDLYRLDQPEEAFELGMEEAFRTAVSLIEWPAKLGPYLPPGFLTLRLEIIPAGDPENMPRKLTIIGDGDWKNRLQKMLQGVYMP